MLNALEGIPMFYINVDGSNARNELIISQIEKFKIANSFRISASTPKNIFQEYPDTSKTELACFESHIRALLEFVNNTESEYALVCEDDVDLSGILKIKGKILDGLIINKISILQASIVLRVEDPMIIAPHKKSFWEFGTMAYFISRASAEEILNRFCTDGKLNIKSFTSKTIQDPRGGFINSRPVADHAIYPADTVVLPLFSQNYVASEIRNMPEGDLQVSTTIRKYNSSWSQILEFKIDDSWLII